MNVTKIFDPRVTVSAHFTATVASTPKPLTAEAMLTSKSERTVLVKLDTVCSYSGKTADQVFAMADGSALFHEGLEFVFNVAASRDGRRRDLRFWFREVLARSAKIQFPAFTLDQALEKILPLTIAHFAPGRICGIFRIADNTLMNLRGEIGQPQGAISREKLATFLRRRWLGADNLHTETPHTKQHYV
jgi:hypothetical protein